MAEPQSLEELRAQSAAFDARLEALNDRLTELEVTRPPQGADRNIRREQDRWQKKMQTLTRQGDEWGHEYLDFLRRGEPLLAGWAESEPSLQDELVAWRESLSQMENSLGR